MRCCNNGILLSWLIRLGLIQADRLTSLRLVANVIFDCAYQKMRRTKPSEILSWQLDVLLACLFVYLLFILEEGETFKLN